MTDISYIELNSMSDDALITHIGAFIKHHRISQNTTQHDLASKAGISRSTLSLLEQGESVNLSTLIQILRVLDQLQVLNSFSTQEQISPLALAKMQKEKRQRASGKKKDQSNDSNW